MYQKYVFFLHGNRKCGQSKADNCTWGEAQHAAKDIKQREETHFVLSQY